MAGPGAVAVIHLGVCLCVVVGLQLHLVALALVLWELDDPGPG